ncbi:PhoX family protein [Blastococcus sp. SYSU DS0973]
MSAGRVSGERRPSATATAGSPPRRRSPLTGPAAGSEYLGTSADPEGRTVLGTLNNCAGGVTPWGTTLHGEEDFNQYFGTTTPITDATQLAALRRYGVSPEDVPTRRWHTVDPRFDLSKEPNEVNRFGWVVEVDPYDPTSTPRKHTALGRFEHKGADVQIAADGRVVAYSGDGERFDHIYKFVSRKKYREGHDRATRQHNMTLLEDGDLYVARFTGDSPAAELDGSGRLPSDGEFDGTGQWIPLVEDGESMMPGKDVAWVLTFTRQAADRLGKVLDVNGDFPDPADVQVIDPAKLPTMMDRPEGIQVNGRVYAALTSNSNRTGQNGRPGADEANPLTRSWAFEPANEEKGTQASYGEQPGNRNGHVIEWEEDWSATGDTFNWRIFLVCGAPERGHLKAFLTVPFGAECSGPTIPADGRSVFVSAQHPGETTCSTRDHPSSTWPDRLPQRPFPRPSGAVAYRTDGGRVGS